jgi:hypothetical protein
MLVKPVFPARPAFSGLDSSGQAAALFGGWMPKDRRPEAEKAESLHWGRSCGNRNSAYGTERQPGSSIQIIPPSTFAG